MNLDLQKSSRTSVLVYRMPEPLERPELPIACEEVRDLLALVAMGELPEDEAPRVHAHLVVCRACGQALMEHRKLVGLLWREMPFRRRAFHSHES
jgi:hypothetical protein